MPNGVCGDVSAASAARHCDDVYILLPSNALALGALPADEAANASGLSNFMRNLSGAIGLAVANTLTAQCQNVSYVHLHSYVTAAEVATTSACQQLSVAAEQHACPEPARAGLELVARIAWREADVLTANQQFQLLGGMSFAALLLMPLARPVDMAQSGTDQ